MGDSNTADVERALLDLRPVIGFESAQLVKFGPADTVDEICRIGYRHDTALTLAKVFPRVFRSGFTARASPDAPLPATISTSNNIFREEFLTSRLYRDHLFRDGYVDGMSVELSTGGRSVGLAHFSSRVPRAFAGDVRRTTLSMSGMLALSLAHHAGPSEAGPDESAGSSTGLYDAARSEWAADLPAEFRELQTQDNFAHHLGEVVRLDVKSADHLWLQGGQLVLVRLRQVTGSALVSVGVSRATSAQHAEVTAREVQVLSCLCCGLTDAAISRRLSLSPRTVQAYMGSLRQKLRATNRVDLAMISVGTGLYIPHPQLSPVGQILRGPLDLRVGPARTCG